MKYLSLILVFTVLFSCAKKEKEYSRMDNGDAERSVTVEQIQKAGDYTYLYVNEDEGSYWIAVSEDNFEKGETLYFSSYLVMNEFQSKELDKTFDQILFVDKVSRVAGQSAVETRAPSKASPHEKSRMGSMLDSIKIAPAEGGVSIAELYGQAEQLKDKEVIVRGKIVKINSDIMDRNWVHIMDGTKGERSDLTFTTNEVFQLGDTVTVKGKVAVDKDFGGGYVYPLIVEEANLIE